MRSDIFYIAYIILSVGFVAGCPTDRQARPMGEGSLAEGVSAPAPANAGSSAKVDGDGDELRALFEPFAIAAVEGHLQGTWVFSGGIHNVATAWHVEERSFTYVDQEGVAKAGELDILAPCMIAHAARSGGLYVANYRIVLATADGVFTGGTSIGMVRGERFVVCTWDGIILGDGRECGLWRDVGGVEIQWRRSEATCAFSGEVGAKEHFWAKAEGMEEVRLDVHGELLLLWSPEEMRGRREASLDAAIASVGAANGVSDRPAPD